MIIPTNTIDVPPTDIPEIPTPTQDIEIPTTTPILETPVATLTDQSPTPTSTVEFTATATAVMTETPSVPPFINCDGVSEIPTAECQALVDLFDSTSGSSWTVNTNWKQTNEPCSWYGVSCSVGHVTGLNFNGIDTGERFSGNNLVGNLPDSLSNLTNLHQLLMENNQINGTIPLSLTGLTSLESIDLANNHLTGSIPAGLGNLTNLKLLNLSDNNITEGIPDEIGNLTKLTALSVRSTSLNGSLPESLIHLMTLSQFDYSNTQLCEPGTSDFQNWLGTISSLSRTGICPVGNITGKVTKRDDNSPILTSVCIRSYDSDEDKGCFKTDNQGVYTAPNLPTGDYRVFVNETGYALQYYNHTFIRSEAKRVSVGSGGTTSGIDFSLSLGATVTGTVFTEDGSTRLAKINVSLDAGGTKGVMNTCTDSDGNYSFTGVPFDSKFQVFAARGKNNCDNNSKVYSAQYWDHTDSEQKAASISVTSAEQGKTGVNFYLATAGKITGTVTSAATGLPVSDVCAYIETYDNSSSGNCFYTNLNGVYLSDPLDPGDYRVRIDQPGYALQYYNNTTDWNSAARVKVTSGATKTGINFSLQPGGTVIGMIYGPDGITPIHDMNVTLDGDGLGFWACSYPDGHYEYRSVPLNKKFKLRVAPVESTNWCKDGAPSEYPELFWNNTNEWNEATELELTASSPTLTDINFTMRVGGHISGRVTTASNGNPISGANVCFETYDNGTFGGCVNTDNTGNYTSDILSASDYRVKIYSSGWGWQFYDHTTNWGNAARVSVSDGNTTNNIDFALVNGGTISGTVFAANGTTRLPNVVVVAETPDGGSGVCTDSQGNYSFDRYIPTGTDIRIRAGVIDWGNFCGDNTQKTYAQQFWKYADTFDSATVIRLDGSTPANNINFKLKQGGVIKGHVFDKNTSANLANIKVALTTDNRFIDTCTDSNGNYQFTGVEGNTAWRVVAVPDGNYCNGFIPPYSRLYWNNSASWGSATTLTITTQKMLYENINFGLSSGGLISGKVTSLASGDPLPDTSVCIDNYDTQEWVYCATTDKAGNYISPRLASGDYRVYIYKDNYGFQFYNQTLIWDNATRVTVVNGSTTEGINFELVNGGTIQGIVTDKQDNPLPNMNVDISDGSFSNGVCTDQNGEYSIKWVPFDTPVQVSVGLGLNSCQGGVVSKYSAQFWENASTRQDASTITLNDGNPLAENINFSLDTAGVISGYVFDTSGNPLANAWVGLRLHGSHTFLENWSQTGSDGKYSKGAIPPGTYDVIVAHDGYALYHYNNSPSWQDADPITITPGQKLTGINFILPPGGTISGKVLNSDGVSPLSNFPVWIGDANFGVGDFQCTNETGEFASGIIRLNTDVYVVAAPVGIQNWCSHSTDGYTPEYWQNANNTQNATTLKLTSQGQVINGINLVMSSSGTITGTVRQASDNTPQAGIDVCIQDFDNYKIERGCFTTDENGVYIAPNMPAGDYRVFVYKDHWAWALYNNTDLWGDATRVVVTAGNTTSGIDLSLYPAGTVSGTVYAEDGITPLPNMAVEIDWGNDAGSSFNCSDEHGNYSFFSIPFNKPLMAITSRVENWCEGGSEAYSTQFYPFSDTIAGVEEFTLTESSPIKTGVDFKMKLDTTAPDTPVQISPLSGKSFSSPPVFSWNDVGSQRYNFMLAKNADFSSPIISITQHEHTFTPASLSPGKYYWRVRATDLAGNKSSFSPVWIVYITLAKPELNLPANGASIFGTPTFSWSSLVGASSYRFEYDDDTDFSSPTFSSGVLTTTSITPPLMKAGNYYWHVKAVDIYGNSSPWSTGRSITIQSPKIPILTYPTDDLSPVRVVPTFTWGTVTGATAYQFQLTNVDKSTTFTTPGEGVSGTPLTTTSYKPASMVVMDHYTWRVQARDAAGNWSGWSPEWHFQLKPPLITAAPALKLPAVNVLINAPTFSWAAVTNAATYDIEIDTATSFASTDYLSETGLTALTYTPSGLSPDGGWFWRVRAVNAFNEAGPWSPARSFILDTTAPTVPVLISPTDDLSPVRVVPTFTWGTVTGATAYQFQLTNVDKSTTFTTPGEGVSGTPLTTTSYKPASMVVMDHYTWRVQARDAAGNWSGWSPEWHFQLKPPLITAAPALKLPAVNVLINAPTFSWAAVTNAATYDIEIDTATSFASTNYLSETGLTALTYTPPGLSPDGGWFWRVRAVNAFNEAGPWSPARTFTLDTTPPTVPVLISPTDDLSPVRVVPTFTWGTVTGATAYQFQLTDVDKSTTFTTPGEGVSGTPLTTTSYKPASMVVMDHYTWRVQARDAAGNWSGWSPEWHFQLKPPLITAAPALKLPAVNVLINAPTFSWAAVTNAATYDIEIDTDTSFASTDYLSETGLTALSYTPPGLSPDGGWFWRVRAVNAFNEAGPWSPARTFTLDTKGPDAPSLTSPVSDILTNNTKPTFTWKTTPTGVKYQIEFSTDNSPFVPIYTSGELTTTSFIPTTSLPAGEIYWHVRARDISGNWGEWSDVWDIIIDLNPPAAPVLYSPVDGLSTMNTTPTFAWLSVDTAVGYQFRYDNDANFSSPVFTSPTLTGNTFTAPKMASGTYYWQIRAIDHAGNWGAWSTSRMIQVDLEPPPAPILLSPAEGTISINPIFQWNASAGSIGYLIQIDSQSTFTAPIDYTSFESSTSHLLGKFIQAGKYYWRVRAADEAGNWGTWSAVRSFTIPG
ncbi:hypothetical protein ADM99_11425 [Leptolinea tardivitalis]|uniref:Fibronectin type-III domain-containing protein n=1 Tax=Leptolinea tardivitalis TaxID=229920 RepID=A0A0P6X9V0_9CHLR|nr:hypothetical protein ADM99_11425 [Leptolinea tardivitalis]